MTFRLKDVQPKTGTTVNIKPYSGSPKKYRKSDVRRLRQIRAIERIKLYVGR